MEKSCKGRLADVRIGNLKSVCALRYKRISQFQHHHKIHKPLVDCPKPITIEKFLQVRDSKPKK